MSEACPYIYRGREGTAYCTLAERAAPRNAPQLEAIASAAREIDARVSDREVLAYAEQILALVGQLREGA